MIENSSQRWAGKDWLEPDWRELWMPSVVVRVCLERQNHYNYYRVMVYCKNATIHDCERSWSISAFHCSVTNHSKTLWLKKTIILPVPAAMVWQGLNWVVFLLFSIGISHVARWECSRGLYSHIWGLAGMSGKLWPLSYLLAAAITSLWFQLWEPLLPFLPLQGRGGGNLL